MPVRFLRWLMFGCAAHRHRSDTGRRGTKGIIAGNAHWIFLVSSHGMEDYIGRLMVKCDFGGINGYAHVSDRTSSNSYLPRME